MNKEQYQKWAREVLGPFDSWEYMFVDDDGECTASQHKPEICPVRNAWVQGDCGWRILGLIKIDFPWQESLVRKQWVPEIGQVYFTPNIHSLEYFVELLFQDNNINRLRLERGLVYKTKDEAIARAKRMLATEY